MNKHHIYFAEKKTLKHCIKHTFDLNYVKFWNSKSDATLNRKSKQWSFNVCWAKSEIMCEKFGGGVNILCYNRGMFTRIIHICQICIDKCHIFQVCILIILLIIIVVVII